MAECPRCEHTLARASRSPIDLSLAFSLAALLLLLPASLSALLTLSAFGTPRHDWLPSGVAALWREGYPPLAIVVLLFSLVIPFLYLGLMAWVLGAIRLGIPLRLGPPLRRASQLRPWAMIEVYLVGGCVAYSRLETIGPVTVDAGGWCLLGAAAAIFLAALCLDERSVWDRLSFSAEPNSGRQLIGCEVCSLVLDAERTGAPCPRCGAALHSRKPYASGRTWALVLAGLFLYAPAMLLPVLRIERFGREEPNTILSGVRELISAKLWLLAAIVFIASIVVPLLKLLGLAIMLAFMGQRSRRWLLGRARLYRMIEFIGRWSSIDLFMISILVALVRFGTLTSVHPEAGALAFAAVIVITMMASRSFDPRLMWDAADGAT
jgi:paraquat-inducible protein A